MAKMTIELLNKIKAQNVHHIEQRQIHQEASYKGKYQVLVCVSTGCLSTDSKAVLTRFQQKVKEAKLQDKVDIVPTGCPGYCEMGPVVIVYPQGAFYAKVQPEDVDKIVESHLINNQVVKEKLF
jgi:(2Fe-2S) ferredoxin